MYKHVAGNMDSRPTNHFQIPHHCLSQQQQESDASEPSDQQVTSRWLTRSHLRTAAAWSFGHPPCGLPPDRANASWRIQSRVNERSQMWASMKNLYMCCPCSDASLSLHMYVRICVFLDYPRFCDMVLHGVAIFYKNSNGLQRLPIQGWSSGKG